MMNLRAEARSKPHSASFSSLQTNESFHHFRSVSYFEAVANTSLSGSHKSFEIGDKPRLARIPSSSTPCTPKKIEIEKYSTLPVSAGVTYPGKKTRSSSLSSFFRKLRPRFHRSSSDGKNPWIVIEFAAHNDGIDDASSDSEKSDHSIEQAVQSKAQHFTSLKDIHDNHSIDGCNCPLRKDSVLHCNMNSLSGSKASVNYPSKYKSETSLFFRLSPRRRLENFKHMLKNLSSKRKKFRTSSSMHSLGSRTCSFRSESCLKTNCKISSGAFSNFSQVVVDL